MNSNDIKELAIAVLGLPEDSEYDYIEETLYTQFQCSFDQFESIAEALMLFTIPVKSSIDNRMYQGFVKDNCFIAKTEFKG